MSTQELMSIVKDRGLDITLKDGQPILQRPNGNANVTDELMRVLKHHRDRIVALLSRGTT